MVLKILFTLIHLAVVCIFLALLFCFTNFLKMSPENALTKTIAVFCLIGICLILIPLYLFRAIVRIWSDEIDEMLGINKNNYLHEEE